MKGDERDEKYLPRKLLIDNQRHNITFSVSAQTAWNVGMIIVCKECLVYATQELKLPELESFYHMLNDIVCVVHHRMRYT